MNKAFVKDPEPDEACCPPPLGCGKPGIPVSHATLRAQLGTARADAFSSSAAWCPTPECDVAYFDLWGQSVRGEALEAMPWPKDPQGVLCPCTGTTPETLRIEAAQGKRDTIRRLLALAEGPRSRCAECSPSGRSCVIAARKLFLEHFRPAQS